MNCFYPHEFLGSIGSVMSKIIIIYFTCIGAITTAEQLRTHYPTNLQIIYGGAILLWFLLGGIHEYTKNRSKEKS